MAGGTLHPIGEGMSVSTPLTVPAFLNIDVEPDAFQIKSGDETAWSGYPALYRFLESFAKRTDRRDGASAGVRLVLPHGSANRAGVWQSGRRDQRLPGSDRRPASGGRLFRHSCAPAALVASRADLGS